MTAVVGGMTCAATIDFDRLEECVTFALKSVHPRARPLFLASASAVMEDLEKMQKALAIEKRKNGCVAEVHFDDAGHVVSFEPQEGKAEACQRVIKACR
jgi:hypothetical protein